MDVLKGRQLEDKARQLRQQVVAMLYRAQSGHPGSALSVLDVMVALYFGGLLKHDPLKPNRRDRDYFLLSNGHACPALYAVLADRGYFTPHELGRLRQLGAGAQGHPHRGALPGIEISAGSLGQGLSVGIGLAYALKLKKRAGTVFVMMSDGEQEEGSTWEAIMGAPSLRIKKSGVGKRRMKLDNLIALVDKNGMQIDGATKDIMPTLDPLAEKYRLFGWQTQEIDGHDMTAIVRAVKRAKAARGPAVIVAVTTRGRGVSFMEGSPHWHAGAITEEEYKQASDELSRP